MLKERTTALWAVHGHFWSTCGAANDSLQFHVTLRLPRLGVVPRHIRHTHCHRLHPLLELFRDYVCIHDYCIQQFYPSQYQVPGTRYQVSVGQQSFLSHSQVPPCHKKVHGAGPLGQEGTFPCQSDWSEKLYSSSQIPKKKLYSSSTKVLLRALRRRPWRSWCARLPRPCQCRGRQRWRRWWSWRTQCWWISMDAFKMAGPRSLGPNYWVIKHLLQSIWLFAGRCHHNASSKKPETQRGDKEKVEFRKIVNKKKTTIVGHETNPSFEMK